MTASHVYNITEIPVACQEQLRSSRVFLLDRRPSFRLFRHPISVENLKLGMYNTPVLPPPSPLFCYVHGN